MLQARVNAHALAVFRYAIIPPRKSNGGVEFAANLFDTEMDVMMEDDEFNKYAMFVT
ncbi:hypothetical protein V1505DRAFT_353331 [Lipomyces doorenjongii]